MIEALEERTLLADGIAAVAGAPLTATVGVQLANAVFATYTITDASAEPGTQWRARIDFGDGQIDGPVVPVQAGAEFEFVDTHTYQAPGTYTVTVLIAVPGSGKPNDNTVTLPVTVASPTPTPAPTPTPTPAPTPPPSIGSFAAIGRTFKAKVAKTFHGQVARFSDPHTTPAQFSAVIDWGDSTGSTTGQIRRKGKGRYAVIGSHRYAGPGVYHVTVTIQDAAGRAIAAEGSASLVG
jgi:PKD repeat protein